MWDGVQYMVSCRDKCYFTRVLLISSSSSINIYVYIINMTYHIITISSIIISFIIFIISPTSTFSSSYTTNSDFIFIVSHYNSTRQFGKCLNIIVKYRYRSNVTILPHGQGYLEYVNIYL